MLKHWLNWHKIQKICDKAVDACPSAFKFVLDWLVTSKMLKIFDDAVFSSNDIDLNDIESDIITL